MNTNLFSPINLGVMELSNRMVMAPMTRNRAPGGMPTPLMVEYYAQRATAGLIITEGAQISDQGIGYPATPGIHNEEQAQAWKKITDAVHAKGGHIFVQLWHCGRVSHPDFHGGELPVGPSAIKPAGKAFTDEGLKDFTTPRALDIDELPGIVAQYRHAAAIAMQAGFDGVEIHAANGYLLDQFLRDGSNQRSDAYGGSIANRSRLLLEVMEAVCSEIGGNCVGVRFSPVNAFNDMHDSNPQQLFNYVAEALAKFELAYLHMVEVSMAGKKDDSVDIQEIRKHFTGAYIANGAYDQSRGTSAVAQGEADMVAYGIPYLANPDLPERFMANAPLNKPDQATFYGGDAKGYTDYPLMDAA